MLNMCILIIIITICNLDHKNSNKLVLFLEWTNQIQGEGSICYWFVFIKYLLYLPI